jgi:serine/threonine protein phosphatase PrpC
MWRSPEPRYDVASAIAQGGRSYQEDAIVTDFPFGMDSGVAVLADGMGGHAAGDVASKIVVTEVYSELKFQSANFADFEREIPTMMRAAAKKANACVRAHVQDNPGTRGMGATLVSLVLVENRMFWMSIGDSPLYLLRDGRLRQLNEDHSLAPQIDFMHRQGLISATAAKNHPDRNCLTSVILGGKVARADCPKDPFELKLGDVVVVSSDGLQYLEEPRIQKILHRYRRRKAAEIAGYLLEALDDLADPDQDNISFSVIKLNHMKPVVRKIVAKPLGLIESDSHPATRVAVLPKPDGNGLEEDEPLDADAAEAVEVEPAAARAGSGKAKPKQKVPVGTGEDAVAASMEETDREETEIAAEGIGEAMPRTAKAGV